MSKPNLSVVISAHNNEDLIEGCLKSIRQLADEIIVVDNESTDNTVKIARKYTKLVHKHNNNPLVLNQAKNYGFTKAKGSWALSLDPDERVTPKLAKEIKSATSHKPTSLSRGEALRDYVGYQMPRKNIIFGKWIKHGLWHPDEQVRLFMRDKGKFLLTHNHEKLKVNGQVGNLSGHLLHYNYTSVSQYIDKINHMYSDNEAHTMIKSGKKVQWYDSIRMPLSDFLANFFAREGYKDGLHGLVLSIFQAFYTFTVFAKIWEKQQFKEYNSETFLQETKTEFVAKLQEFSYWYHQKRGIKHAPHKKITSKLSKIFSS